MRQMLPEKTKFENELTTMLNRYSRENGSNTPDFILATFMESCLRAFNHATSERDNWYNVILSPFEKRFR